MKRQITYLFTFLFMAITYFSCQPPEPAKTLHPVSVADFHAFIDATNYITDAEGYGWSIVQINVFEFETVDSATWRKPNGIDPPYHEDLPVTQVSYNDAVAYCEWAGGRLPTYEEYWDLVKDDKRPIISDNKYPISALDTVNIVGNVWEITEPLQANQIRLAGGSLFCSENTCHGTQPDRELFVDSETGNWHIGFCILK